MRSSSKKKIFIIILFLFASPGSALYFYMVRLLKVGARKVCGVIYLSKKKDLIHSASLFTIQMVIPAFVLTTLYRQMIVTLRKPVNFLENARAIQVRKRRHWKIIWLFLTIPVILYVFVFPYQLFYIIFTIQIHVDKNGSLNNHRHYIIYANYLANIFRSRFECELIYSLRSAKHPDYSVHIRCRLAPSPSPMRIFEKKEVLLAIHLHHYSSQQS